MTYALLATAALILIITYIYLKPKQKVTKNIFNAEYYRGLNYLLNTHYNFFCLSLIHLVIKILNY